MKVQVTEGNLKDMVKLNVESNTTIITDSLLAYRGFDKFYVAHEVIKHDQDEYVRGNVHTNTIEGFFAYFKAFYLRNIPPSKPKTFAALL